MGGAPVWSILGGIVWIIGGLLVLALLWFLFTRLATSERGAESQPTDARGPSGAAWEQKFPDAGGADEGGVPPRT